MSTATNHICLTGLDFRLSPVVCRHCSWNGRAGELRTPGPGELRSAGLGEEMKYACPECHQTIAVHKGLSGREVMRELQEIRQILAAEMSATLCGSGEGSEKGIERSEFVVAVENIQASVGVSKILTEPEIVKQAQPGSTASPVSGLSVSVASGAAGGDLNFAEVRARLAGIA